MRVLSIDLDYIMGKSIDLYEDIGWDDNPHIRWEKYFLEKKSEDNNICIDESNLYYCFDIFLKALCNCKNVTFAYNHDSILDYLVDFDNIDLVNIDHHDDIIYDLGDYDTSDDNPNRSIEYMKSLYMAYQNIETNYQVNEGNWISLLHIKNKIKSICFIGNEDSIDFGPEKKSFIDKKFSDIKIKITTKDNHNFGNFNFDYIFVCLSPQYIPPFHWHYFKMFLIAYENITGKTVDMKKMPIRNFSNNYEYSKTFDVLNPRYNQL